MDFFKSILAEDPNSPVDEEPQISEPKNPYQIDKEDNDQSPNSSPSSSDGGGDTAGWSFRGLIKTFTTRSESVLETYRRDLKEFGSGLKKETALIREAASRAVKELPASIEVAKGSVETVGHAIDGVLKSTAEIISHGKDTLLAPSDVESDASGTPSYSNQSFNSRRYSRFDAQLRAIQSDVNTYCEEAEDLDDYSKWRLGFVAEEKSEEIENLIEENGVLEGMYKRVVPNSVDCETFWCRYFYRVHKLKQQEDVRANLVKRAISADDEEVLTWDIDDEDEDEESDGSSKGNVLEKKELGGKYLNQVVKEDSSSDEPQIENSGVVGAKEGNEASVVNVHKSIAAETFKEVQPEKASEMNNEELALDGKADHGESCKDSDISVVSSQPSMPEEDLGWDEIEDLGSNDDEKKVTHGGSLNRADPRKRLSVDDEDEDLNWDIEDDEEHVKA